jgi:hypothetical protein
MNARQMCVGAVKLKPDGSGGPLGFPAYEFRLGELEARRERNSRLVIAAGHRVLDRCGGGLD